MYMRISKNHNSLGYEQPLGLDVNMYMYIHVHCTCTCTYMFTLLHTDAVILVRPYSEYSEWKVKLFMHTEYTQHSCTRNRITEAINRITGWVVYKGVGRQWDVYLWSKTKATLAVKFHKLQHIFECSNTDCVYSTENGSILVNV